MPRVATPCRNPACPAPATQQGVCDSHARQRDQARGTSASRGYNARHRRWREYILQRDPCCMIREKCDGAPSTVAEHIVPLRRGGTWDYANGQGACESCANWKTATQDGGFGR